MAMSLSSSRRSDYRHPPSGSSMNSMSASVVPYPSPLSLRSTTHHHSTSSAQQASGLIPGPAPGNPTKVGTSNGLSRRPPPPPSQERQYAQHFPPLNYSSAVPVHNTVRGDHEGNGEGGEQQQQRLAIPSRDSASRVATSTSQSHDWQHQQMLLSQRPAPRYIYEQPGGYYGHSNDSNNNPIPLTTAEHQMPDYYSHPHYSGGPDSTGRSAREYNDSIQRQSPYEGRGRPSPLYLGSSPQSASPNSHKSLNYHYSNYLSLQPVIVHHSNNRSNKPVITTSQEQERQICSPPDHPHRHHQDRNHFPRHHQQPQQITNSTVEQQQQQQQQQQHASSFDDDNNNNQQSEDHANNHQSSSFDAMAGNSLHHIRIRAVVSGWKAGTIIGRQGQVISNLRSESQCKITISDDPTTVNRVLSITGRPARVSDVLRRVCFLIGNSANAYYSGRDVNQSEYPTTTAKSCCSTSLHDKSNSPQHSDQDETNSERGTANTDAGKTSSSLPRISFTLAVPSPLCGCLIGKAGNQIKNFRQKFSVLFSVSSHSILESSDRPVNISGSPGNVANCLHEICRLFAEPLASTSVSSRAARQQQQDPSGGSLNEPSEGRNPYGAFQSNWRRNLSDADAADLVHHHGQSEEENVGNNRRLSLQQYDSKPNTKKPRRRPSRLHTSADYQDEHPNSSGVLGSNGSRGEVLGSAIEECSFTLNTGETEVHLLVPNDIIGCIIGKGGQTISEIRATSGALISITESQFPPPMPMNAVGSSFPSSSRSSREQQMMNNRERRGMRSRDRVICIRGRSKDIRTARYLMGSSILSAQKTTNGGTATTGATGATGPPLSLSATRQS